MDILVGNKIKQLRKEQKMSIAELSRRSDVSTGLISQIERDLVVPSITSLWRIAKALNTSINFFFEEAEDAAGTTIIRDGEHRNIVTHKGSSNYKMLCSSNDNRALDLTEVTLKGGTSYEAMVPVTHEGEECGYVIKGTLTVELNGIKHVLKEGDSIHFSSSLRHKYMNETDDECVSIWAMTPKFF